MFGTHFSGLRAQDGGTAGRYQGPISQSEGCAVQRSIAGGDGAGPHVIEAAPRFRPRRDWKRGTKGREGDLCGFAHDRRGDAGCVVFLVAAYSISGRKKVNIPKVKSTGSRLNTCCMPT